MRTRVLALTGALNAGFAAVVAAAPPAEPTKEQVAFFENKVLPILSENCYKCHSQEQGKSKGGLTLDTHAALMKGGDNGAVVTPGDPAKSPLITAIKYLDPDLQMPPKGEKLKDDQVATLIEWVKMGAIHTKKGAKVSKLSGLTDKARAHWAFQPVTKPAIPTNKNQAWCYTPVDTFILQKLEAKGMQAGRDPGAGEKNEKMTQRGVLIRRATYDLTGLPPTLDELNAFLLDPAPTPQAFSKVVDRLLASPHYGERWGRFWLDTARYADTIGGDRGDRNRDYRYPYAYTYRDYVIRAFNQDKPYDQFIVEQLAADKLPDIDKDKTRLAALGFLTVGQRFGNKNDEINDRIDVVSKGFLGLTVACARCHDHMFDPIPTKDYYALHGIFNSITEPSDAPLVNNPDPKLLKDFEAKLAMFEAENRKEFYKVVEDKNWMFRQNATAYLMASHKDKFANSEKAQLRRDELIKEHKLDPVLVNYVGGRSRGGDDSVWGPWKRFSDMVDGDYDFLGPKICEEIATNKGGKYNATVAAAFAGQKPKEIEDVAAIYGKIFESVEPKGKEFMVALASATDEEVSGFDKAMRQLLTQPLAAEVPVKMTTDRVREMSNGWPNQFRGGAKFKFAAINELKLTHDGAPARAMIVTDKPKPQDTAVMIRGQAETRGDVVPRRFLEVLSGPKPQPFPTDSSGRLELAKAIASKSNPLTARVIVNRVWMHHFGEGFVRTPDDIGTQSEPPSHPELIDYLASYLMEQNWSLKTLHRLIMNSRVYQISSNTNDAYAALDPENRLLWRANVRRLDFEAMRDSLLVFSGKLDRTVGGQPINLTDEPYSYRRSVYGYIDRGNLPELMAHFDFSNPDMPNSKRTSTIVPQQALYLMNSPMAIDVARSVIARREISVDIPPERQFDVRRVNVLHYLLFQRQPKPEEINLAFAFLATEAKNQPASTEEQKKINEKLAKKAEESAGDMMMMNRNDGYKAIQNEGKFVERKPLTQWETYAQALLLSNEAAYVN
jgi:hypothetical protein